jgi:hypothetical protein
MKRFVVLALLCLTACVSVTAGAQARSSYAWPSSEKYAFEDHWSTWATNEGYRYPYLYADCLYKASAAMAPTYSAYFKIPTNRWIKSPGVSHCIAVYAVKWWDN